MKDLRFERALLVGAIVLGSATLSGCSAAPAVVNVAEVVVVAATLAEKAVSEATTFSQAYFAAHPDAALQAKLAGVLTRANDAAAALASLGSGVTDVAEMDYLSALAAFKAAYQDVVDAIKGLPMAEVVVGGARTMVVHSPAKMVFVPMSPAVFSGRVAKKVSK